MYLRASIRMVQALQYLPYSPLLELIVNPKLENYQLPPLTEQQISSPLVTNEKLNQQQLEAVYRVKDVVMKGEAKVCLIEGPPGTGKSTVIANLVSEILFGQTQGKKYERILVCATSNAALDEIMLRLLNIRSYLKQSEIAVKRFKLVRIGQVEKMHPKVKSISVSELGKQYILKMTKETEKSIIDKMDTLKERSKSLKTKIASTDTTNEEERKLYRQKLSKVSAKYQLLKSSKQLNSTDCTKFPRKLLEYNIISNANVIACTLASSYASLMKSIFSDPHTFLRSILQSMRIHRIQYFFSIKPHMT